jgi:hypothetical protein
MTTNKHHALYLALTVVALILPTIFIMQSGTGDTKIFLEWMDTMLQYGPIQGFTELHRDYPPLTPLVLYLIGGLANLISLDHFLAFKLSLLIGNWLVWWIMWRWSKHYWLSLGMYLGMILNTVIMGYSDVYIAVVLLLGLWCLQQKRWYLATSLLTFMMFLKWTPLVLGLPLFIYVGYSTYRQDGWKLLFTQAALPAVALSSVIISYFGYTALHDAWIYASSQTFLSGNALNVNWLLTGWLHWRNPLAYGGLEAGVTYIQLSDVQLMQWLRWLFYAVYFFTVGVFLFKRKTLEQFLIMSLLAYLAYFLFNLGVHENHLFFAMMISGALTAVDRRYWPLLVGWALAFNLNLLSFFGEFRSWRVLGGFDTSLLFAGLNVLGWLLTWWYYGLTDWIFRRSLSSKHA